VIEGMESTNAISYSRRFVRLRLPTAADAASRDPALHRALEPEHFRHILFVSQGVVSPSARCVRASTA
jgi:hypothetical protein